MSDYYCSMVALFGVQSCQVTVWKYHNWSNPRYIVIDQTMCVHKIGAGKSVISTSTYTTFNIIQHRIMTHWFQQVSNFNLKVDSILHRAQCPKHPMHDDASSDKSCINRKNRTRPRSSKTCLPRREFEGTWHTGIWRLLDWKLFFGAAEPLCRVKPGAWATGWLQTLFVTVPCTKYDRFFFAGPALFRGTPNMFSWEAPLPFFPKFFWPPWSSRHCSLQESVLGDVQKGTASWLSIGCWCLKKSDIIWLSSLSKWHHPILKRPGVHFDLGLTLAFQELHAVASPLLDFPSLAVSSLAVTRRDLTVWTWRNHQIETPVIDTTSTTHMFFGPYSKNGVHWVASFFSTGE